MLARAKDNAAVASDPEGKPGRSHRHAATQLRSGRSAATSAVWRSPDRSVLVPQFEQLVAQTEGMRLQHVSSKPTELEQLVAHGGSPVGGVLVLLAAAGDGTLPVSPEWVLHRAVRDVTKTPHDGWLGTLAALIAGRPHLQWGYQVNGLAEALAGLALSAGEITDVCLRIASRDLHVARRALLTLPATTVAALTRTADVAWRQALGMDLDGAVPRPTPLGRAAAKSDLP